MLSNQSNGYTGAIVFHENGFAIKIHARHAEGARTLPSAAMFRAILTREQALLLDHQAGVCFIQFGDRAEYPIASVAYCRRKTSKSIALVPDTYFFESDGYGALRQSAFQKELPIWKDRRDKVFWRGNPTFSHISEDGILIESVDQIPRVRLCEQLANDLRADVGLSGVWGQARIREPMLDVFRERRISRGKVNMIQEAPKYKYMIDIDGVACAWGFFEKLLTGSCVLKVDSPYEQWFYTDLKPGIHYVPVRDDLRDLHEKIDWCFSNDREAEEIGRAGQAVALEETFARARRGAALAIKEKTVNVDRHDGSNSRKADPVEQ